MNCSAPPTSATDSAGSLEPWIERELQLESWVDRVEGRKVFTLGTISIDGEVTARAEGIFIMTQGWKAETK
jgi:hypothetical protein